MVHALNIDISYKELKFILLVFFANIFVLISFNIDCKINNGYNNMAYTYLYIAFFYVSTIIFVFFKIFNKDF